MCVKRNPAPFDPDALRTRAEQIAKTVTLMRGMRKWPAETPPEIQEILDAAGQR